eukprot:PhM_4_TR15662/c6_g1_i3/m.3409
MCTQSVASLYNTIVLFALGGVAPAVSLALTTPHAILSMSTLPSVTGPFWLDSIVILFPLTAFILSTLLHRADALFSSSPDRTSTSSSATSVFPFWFWIVHIILTSLPLLLRRSYMHNIKMVDDSEKQDVLEDSSIGISVGPLMPPPAILVHHHFDDDENNVDGLRKADAITPVSTFDSNDDDQTDMSEGENDGNTANTATHSSNNGKGTLLQQRKGWKVAASTNSHTFKIRYKRGAQIGSGAYGTVAIALNELTGELMAVKTIEFDTNDPNLRNKLDTLQVELNMLRTLEHPNIVQYYFSERVPSTLTGRQGVNIFMEYVPGGSILGVLQQFGALSEVVVASYTEQILLALLYLHESNVVHRDIKSANILLTTEGSCKVADFGTAMVLSAGPMTDADATTQGTPLWMAPEVLREESTLIDWHADIWSLGCTVMEMLTGRPPFEYLNKRGAAALSHVMFAEDVYDLLQLHKLPTPISASCADFLARCFSRDPKQRPSCLSLLQHPFIEAGGAHSPEPSYTKSPTQASLRTNLNTTESRPQSEMSYTHSLDRSGGAAGGVVGIENIHDDEGDEVDQRKSSAGYTTTLLLRKASLMNVLMSVADDEDGNNSFSGSSRKSRANHKLTAADVQREAKRRTDALTRDQQLRSTVLDPAAEKGQACVAVVDKLPPPHLQSPSCGSIISTSQSHSSRRRNELHSDLIDSLRSREEYDENGKGCNVSENDDDDDDDNEDGDNFVEKESVSTAVPEIHTQESIVSLFSPEAI